MDKNDQNFALLAASIAAAGGSVHVSSLDILRFNAGYMLMAESDTRGGLIMHLVPLSNPRPTMLDILSEDERQSLAKRETYEPGPFIDTDSSKD